MNNKEIFSKNLQYYISKKGINQTEFAEDLDYPATTVSNWINAKTYPRIDKIQEMANYFGINKSDLQEEKELKERVVINVNQVPLVGRIAAGTPILAEENIEDYFNLDSSIRADFCLKIKGDSMIDEGIYNNDIVFIRKQDILENGQIGAILIEDEATLKTFYKEDGTVILQPANKEYKPIIFTNGNIRVLGRLVAVLNIRN